MSAKTREALGLIMAELAEMRGIVVQFDAKLRGIEVAIGEFHHDVEGQDERQNAELQQARTRLNSLERERIPAIERRVQQLEKTGRPT